jgi:hypothetical protein
LNVRKKRRYFNAEDGSFVRDEWIEEDEDEIIK